MKTASDFRRIAREALNGKWLIAVAVGLVAVILGGTGADTPEIKLNIDASSANARIAYAGQTIFSTGGGMDSDIAAFLVGGAVYIAIAVFVMGIIYFVLGSIVELGYCRFNLELADRKNPGFETLFAYFSYWKTAVIARLLQTLYCFLWTLLFVIPGIVATYSYGMTGYILAEHPDMTASEAIAASKEMMKGNRWRLFCLHLSFIGWMILVTFTLGIGNLWLTPYRQAAAAAFYREVSGTERLDEDVNV